MGLVALLMPASLLMVSATTSADAAEAPLTNTSARKAKSKAKLVALPQIVQQGKKPAAAKKAKAALTANIKPRKVNRPVALQVKKGGGWKTVSKTKIPEHQKNVIFEITGDDTTGEDVEVPYVMLKLNK